MNEAIDWFDFITSDIEFQRILPLKTIEINPFRTVLALGSCSRSFALRLKATNRSYIKVRFLNLKIYRPRLIVNEGFLMGCLLIVSLKKLFK